MSLTFQLNGKVPGDPLVSPTFDESYEMRMMEEFGDDYNGYTSNGGMNKSSSPDNFLPTQWSGRNLNVASSFLGTENGSGTCATNESSIMTGKENDRNAFGDVTRVWPPSAAFTSHLQQQNERRTPQMMMTYTAAAHASTRQGGHRGHVVSGLGLGDVGTAYDPAKSDEHHDQMEKVIALARKLNMSGVLRDPNEVHLQLEQPTSSSRPQFLSRNICLASARPSDSGPFARPRNYSLPDAPNSYSTVPTSRLNFPHNCPLELPTRRQDLQRNRNPYAPSAPIEYKKTIRRGPSDNPPLNPYAPNGFSSLCNENTIVRGNGIYQNTQHHAIQNRLSNAWPPQKTGWPTAHGRSAETRRHANGNNKNPLLQPPPTEDFFATIEQSSSADSQFQLQVVRSFGEYGPAAGQFNMPQGLCLGMNDEIIVADTLNHRIEIFDQSGKFMFLWGCPGVKKGQLWHPRKVAYIPATEHVVVSDRVNGCSRIQIFERTGQYLKTLGNLHGLRMALNTTTAGLTVYNNQIIVVEVQPSACVVLNEDGSVVYWFSLDGIMVEPSDIVVINEKHYISDFRDHCVCVFNNWGHLIQRLGACPDGLIRYPRGLGVTASGHLLVADTDLNRFHISLWNSDSGQLVSHHGLNDIKVSHSCGVVMNSSGQVMTAVKKDHMVLMLKFGESMPPGMLSRDNGHLQRGWNVHAATFHSRVDEVA